MQRNSGQIEIRILAVILIGAVVVLMIWGGTWGHRVAGFLLLLGAFFFTAFLLAAHSSIREKETDDMTLSEFLDTYAYQINNTDRRTIDEFQLHGEYGLAVEWTSNMIYDYDIAVPKEGILLFKKLAKNAGVTKKYWRFMENGPPYPKETTPTEDREAAYAAAPSLEGAEYFAKKGMSILAIRIYREVTGASLAEAKRAVEAWTH
jgi:hypothetical protein